MKLEYMEKLITFHKVMILLEGNCYFDIYDRVFNTKNFTYIQHV